MGSHGLAAVPLVLALAGAQHGSTAPGKEVTHEMLDDRVMKGRVIPHGPMVYLVTPSGHVFRVLGQQPILDAEGKKIGTLVSYVGDTRDPVVASSENVELMEALGLDMQIAGESAVLVQAQVESDQRKLIAFQRSFVLRDGQWTPLSAPPRASGAPCASGSIGEGPIEILDDPPFAFDRQGLAEAVTVARRYAGAVDTRSFDRMRAELSPQYIAEVVDAKPNAWRQEMSLYARIRKGAARREMYRVLFRDAPSGVVGARANFALDLDIPGKRALEAVVLRREPGGWKVLGYGFYYPKEAEHSKKRP